MSILYPELETLSIDCIKQEQLKKINNMLSYIQQSSYYQNKYPTEVSSFDDFEKLPLISKQTLQQNFPYGLLSCTQEKIVRFNASSGTFGIPTLSYCTQNDLDDLAKNEAIHFSRAGVSDKNIIQCMMGFNLFTAGWCCYQGALQLGAAIIPSGPGNTQRQIDLLKQLKADYIFSTPGYLQHLLEFISAQEIVQMNVQKAITGGEVLTHEFQKLAKEQYGIEVFNFYGMTEFAGHIASECEYHQGLHINEDYFYVEIIDPKTGKTISDGEYGEVVVTNLKREAMPLIRYRTGDIAKIIPEKCSCGRTHRRLESITHRIDDMMIINGVNVYPSQIEECLYKHISTATNYLIHVTQKGGLKKLWVDVELPHEMLNNVDVLKKLKNELTVTLKSYITVTPNLNFVSLGTLEEIQGKTKRVVKD